MTRGQIFNKKALFFDMMKVGNSQQETMQHV